MSEQLKPCPFCGGSNLGGFGGAACLDCGGEGPDACGEDEAIAAWNHRPAEDALRHELRERAEALDAEVLPACCNCGAPLYDPETAWVDDDGCMWCPDAKCSHYAEMEPDQC